MGRHKKHHQTENFGDLDYCLSRFLSSELRESEETHRAYRHDIAEFLDSVGKPFDQVGEDDIAEYQATLFHNADRKKRTSARKVYAVRSFYRFLNRLKVTSVNLDALEPIKVKRTIDHGKYLSRPEVNALINAAEPDPPLQLLVRFLYLTGCRISEALNLIWERLEPMPEQGGGEAYVIGKGNEPRSVFIKEALWDDLMESRGAAEDDGKVFPAFANYHAAWRAIKALAKPAKIKKRVSPHSLRHAFISHSAATASIVDVKDAAGHKSLATTTLYAHAGSKRAAADALTDVGERKKGRNTTSRKK